MESKVWMITGASRGIGAEIARAALAAGHQVVATSRNKESVEKALGGSHERLLAVSLDVTNPEQANIAVEAAKARFGRIDVLVNNAGYALAGAVEEITLDEFQKQYDTNVFGLWNVTKAALPTLRAQRSGHILNLSSIGGWVGMAGAGAYCSSKFAIEGLSEALQAELKPLGIHVTIVEPGAFRTDFLESNSMSLSQSTIEDYAETAGVVRNALSNSSGLQEGDPKKLSQALLDIVASDEPPLRLLLGSDAAQLMEAKLESTRKEFEKWKPVSVSMAFDGEEAGPSLLSQMTSSSSA